MIPYDLYNLYLEKVIMLPEDSRDWVLIFYLFLSALRDDLKELLRNTRKFKMLRFSSFKTKLAEVTTLSKLRYATVVAYKHAIKERSSDGCIR